MSGRRVPESAKAATDRRAAARVVLPIAMPGLVTALVYTFIGAWNEYVVALAVTSSSNRTTLTRAIPGFVTSYQEQWQ
ncbi:ABC transporter permease subunit [Streptomyces sp. NPDC001604]|uniref:ABC transporter permease subunit n=1 Tax=Streptomyces sp. NPDC001604 TaxID=3364593 RepID=UPI0036A0FCBA